MGLSCARRAFVGFFSSPWSGHPLSPSSERRVVYGKIDRRDRSRFHVRRAWTELRWQGEKETVKRTGKFCGGEVEKDHDYPDCVISRLLDELGARAIIDLHRTLWDRWDSPHGSSN